MPEEDRPVAGSQPYQALYRRYRPQRFADVLGQDHVTRALRNAVQEGRVAHAYLFSGPRGTGKTSTARILAMALNCEAPQAGEPDGTCASCLSIRSGSSMDVFELDAASNRKLDEMRDLLSRVALGSPGRWKVYIVDEVHQLTPDASSALLKTLEEPPRHVVFVLATTDPQKVLPTILSRTQHFEFRLLDGDLLTELLSGINEDAGLGLSPDAISLAVRRGRGSARDAESVLEQLAVAGGGEDDTGFLGELVEALAERDTGRTLQAIASAISAGRDARRLGYDLLEYLRNAFLAVQAPSLVLLPGVTVTKLAEIARQMTLPFLVRAMEMVGQALVDMRDSVDPRVTLEVALIRLASPVVDASPASLLERIERLERALGERGAVPARPAGAGTSRPSGVPGGQDPSAGASSAEAGPSEAGPSEAGPSEAGPSEAGQPASSAQPKVALGAILRAGGGPTRNAPNPGASGPRPAGPEAATAGSPAAAGAAPPGPAAGNEAAPATPSRDELTKAWGDAVLGRLSPPARLFLANGRFVEDSLRGAAFAFPSGGLLTRARDYQREAESALATYFGRPVPLRMVPDKEAGGGQRPSGSAPGREESYDLDDLGEVVEEPRGTIVPAEQRILQAFPGSVLDG